jgi:5-methylcytosine-specific restriction endonuclease McrA
MRFRERHAPDPSVPRWESRRAASKAYERLVNLVEWKLIEMPLPRLQRLGKSPPFIYEICWEQDVEQAEVTRYQARKANQFDNRLLLKAGVGEYLLQLAGLLRPLIQRRWAAMVALLNRLEESQLELFLFGTDRTQTARIRAGLWEIQRRRCFYCDNRVKELAEGQVDHFVPWSRYPDDGLDNFVVTDKRCNAFKSSSLAAAEHLARWARRFAEDSSEYAQIADLARRTSWDRHTAQTHSVARAIYLRLPNDARLWLRRKEFIAPDLVTIRTALSVSSTGRLAG